MVNKYICSEDYDFIINASAFTKVNDAEVDKSYADQVNHLALKNICSTLLNSKALLIHYSTDYIFDGKSEHEYKEDDPTNPLNHYGLSKLKGEQEIINSPINYFIFRTSWVYDNHGDNFPNKILNQLKKNIPLNVIDDQYGVPNHADLIAEITLKCMKKYFISSDELKNNMIGTYHLSSSGKVSWYDFSEFIIENYFAHQKISKPFSIKRVASSKYDTLVRRPANSVLCCDKIKSMFDVDLPPWQHHAYKFIESKILIEKV